MQWFWPGRFSRQRSMALAVELWTPMEVRPGQTLRVGATRAGARCYLCVRGGIACLHFWGARRRMFLSGLGGFAGRALRKR